LRRDLGHEQAQAVGGIGGAHRAEPEGHDDAADSDLVELADDAGAQLSVSAPCTLGGLTIDVPHFGTYHGRVYAWTLGEPDRSIATADLAVDVPVVQWAVETP